MTVLGVSLIRRMVFLAVLVAAVGVGVASAAFAAASPTVNDPRGDSSGGEDDPFVVDLGGGLHG